MSESRLLLHCGAREVSLDELRNVSCPPPTATWFPVGHATVVDAVGQALAAGGFATQQARYALTRHDARLFATYDLTAVVASGVTLAVGIRNSLDKSFPLSFCAGAKVFVCDNLAFRSELLVKRKHTRHGQHRFVEAIAAAVQELESFRAVEQARVERFQQTLLTTDQQDALVLRAFEQSIISARQLPAVIGQVRQPSCDYGDPSSAWSVFNAFTWVLADVRNGNPQRFAHLTMRLNGLFDARLGATHAA